MKAKYIQAQDKYLLNGDIDLSGEFVRCAANNIGIPLDDYLMHLGRLLGKQESFSPATFSIGYRQSTTCSDIEFDLRSKALSDHFDGYGNILTKTFCKKVKLRGYNGYRRDNGRFYLVNGKEHCSRCHQEISEEFLGFGALQFNLRNRRNRK